MEDVQLIMYVLFLGVLVMTLMMAWASHRKLKTHQYYLQALIEHEITEDQAYADAYEAYVQSQPAEQEQVFEEEMLLEPTVVEEPTVVVEETGMPPAAASLRGSSALRGSGETCNDLRSPIGGKVYNRDCMKASMVGSSASLRTSGATGIPNINTLIQQNYPKSG